jgi:hypothetical protein
MNASRGQKGPLGRLDGSKRDHCVPKKDTAQPKAAINGMKYATKVKNISIKFMPFSRL